MLLVQKIRGKSDILENTGTGKKCYLNYPAELMTMIFSKSLWRSLFLIKLKAWCLQFYSVDSLSSFFGIFDRDNEVDFFQNLLFTKAFVQNTFNYHICASHERKVKSRCTKTILIISFCDSHETKMVLKILKSGYF